MSTTSAVIKRLRAELLRLAEDNIRWQKENERLRQTINDQAATITGMFREIERMLPTPVLDKDK
jgi:regulator of replication initiation timing